MIEARHTLRGKLVSRLYSGPLLSKAFTEIEVVGSYEKSERPILMLANHFSWWDGFIQYRLNRKLGSGKKLYVMMLEEQLRKNMILNGCGCFSVNRNSRDVITTLEYCVDLMQSPSTALLVFPQGELRSMHCESVDFRSGIDYLFRKIDGDYDIVMNVNLTDYGSRKKPSLTLYYQTLSRDEISSSEEIRERYNLFYRECKTKHVLAK